MMTGHFRLCEICTLLAFAAMVASGAPAAGLAESGRCDPAPVVKPVKVVRREIKVSIIGADRPVGPKNVLDATPEGCFAY